MHEARTVATPEAQTTLTSATQRKIKVEPNALQITAADRSLRVATA
jgi:hypothetical protein